MRYLIVFNQQKKQGTDFMRTITSINLILQR